MRRLRSEKSRFLMPGAADFAGERMNAEDFKMSCLACTALLFGMVLLPPILAAGPPGAGSRPLTGLLLVANKRDQTVSIIDPGAAQQVATVREDGFTVHELVASPDGRTAFAPVYGNSGVGRPGTDGRTIDVIDLATRHLVSTIDLGRPLRPHCALFGPKDGLLYVTTELANSITVIDPKTRQIVASIPTGQAESHMLAITPDGRRGYTANVGPGTVSALDLVQRKTLAVIPISKVTQRIALSVEGRYAFTADQTKPQLAVINTETNQVKTWVPLPVVAYGTAPTRDGRWLLITQPESNRVAVLDLKSMKIDRLIDVGKYPQEIVVRPDNQVAYVSCMRDHKIAAINLETWQVDHLIDAGREADGLAWAASR